MGFIEYSTGFLDKLKAIFNKDLAQQNKRIEIIEEAKELPSPVPRISYNLKFMSELRQLVKKHFPEAIVTGVTDTNSMEPVIDKGHTAIIIPFADKGINMKKESIDEGDILLFYRRFDDSPDVMHRVIRRDADGKVITRGDNTVALDGFTLDRDIHGFCGMIIY